MWYIIFIPIWLANTLYSAFPNMNHHPVSPPPRDIYHIFSWCSLTQSHIINFRRVLFSYYWSHCLYAYTRKLTKFNTRSIQIKWDCFIVESLNHKRLISQEHIHSIPWEAPHQWCGGVINCCAPHYSPLIKSVIWMIVSAAAPPTPTYMSSCSAWWQSLWYLWSILTHW